LPWFVTNRNSGPSIAAAAEGGSVAMRECTDSDGGDFYVEAPSRLRGTSSIDRPKFPREETAPHGLRHLATTFLAIGSVGRSRSRARLPGFDRHRVRDAVATRDGGWSLTRRLWLFAEFQGVLVAREPADTPYGPLESAQVSGSCGGRRSGALAAFAAPEGREMVRVDRESVLGSRTALE
jgi:hypothetical protein